MNNYKPTLKHQAICAIRKNCRNYANEYAEAWPGEKPEEKLSPNEALQGVDYWELCEKEFNGDEETMRWWVRERIN